MTTRPFVVDPVLSAISIGFRNPSAFKIADQILPRLPVMGEKFKWTEYPLTEAFETPDAEVGRLGSVNQIEFGGEERDGSVKDYGLQTPIPYSDIEAAENARAEQRGTYDPESHSTEMLTDTMENIREVRVSKLVHNPATYNPDKVRPLSGTSQFNDYDNSDPIGEIKRGLEATLIFMPNTMAMGRSVWTKLSSHPKIVNAVKGNLTNAGIVTKAQFAEIFADYGIKDVLIGDAWTNTAKKGQNANLERAWGNHIALLHINQMASVEGGGITFGFTAEYGNRISGRIDNPQIGLQGGIDLRVGERIREIICAKDVGYLIQNAVAG